MLFTDWLCAGTVIGKLICQLMLKVREGDVRLYLLEHVLRVGVAMVTGELI